MAFNDFMKVVDTMSLALQILLGFIGTVVLSKYLLRGDVIE